MKKMKVSMFREDLEGIPEYSLPDGFEFKLFENGEQADWVRVETAAGEFESEEKAFERFDQEFTSHLEEFSKRCLFIVNQDGEIIGTTSGWYGSLEEEGEVIGKIHWVSILPEYQGQNLAKPLLSAAMNLLKKYHKKAFLNSQTINYKAINMYLQYGFVPVVRNDKDEEAWEILEEVLGKKIIK